jgi:hypothetical protein
MAANPSDTKQHAHQLLDRLDPSRLAAVVHLLEVFLDEDSDTLSPAEAKAIAEADEWSQHNDPIPHEQVLADLGLTMADWEKMGREPLPEETPRRNG